MADISARITRKSLNAKKKAAIKTIKAQAKEKIREVKIEYNVNPERIKAKAQEKAQKQELKMQKANARLAYNERQSRQYTFGEDLFNSISHGIGAGLSVAAIVLLILRAVFHCPEGESVSQCVVGYTIFGASLFIMYMFSTLYHAITPYMARKVFSILNHDAIYILIAGTATPFILTKIPAGTDIVALSCVWGICAALVVLYSVFGSRLRGFSFFTYVVLGWIMVLCFGLGTFAGNLNNLSRTLLITGAISYSVGGLFFLMQKTRWTHSISHLFVLAGSILHFFSVYYLAM